MPEGRQYYIGGQEGKEFEWDIFGAVDTKNPEYQKALWEAANGRNGYIPFKAALNLAKKFQPNDPTNPERGFARDLRIEVIDLLGFTEEKDMDRVKFYTAVGTPLDQWHGIDAFLEVERDDKPNLRVTFDATMATEEEKIKRGQKIKADILVNGRDLSPEDEKKFQENIALIAKRAVAALGLKSIAA